MTFQATVVRILIASPGDTAAARQIIRDAIEDWNSLHAEEAGVILLPVMWERDATPEMGDRPQGIINRQLVDIADVLIGTFWTRLGTPTGEAASGTAEEINECIAAEKPVLIFFSSEPVALASVDRDEYERLEAFRAELRERGLQDEYSSETELYRKIQAALTRTMRDRFQVTTSLLTSLSSQLGDGRSGEPHASPLARVEREREMKGLSRQGRPQYTTRHRLVIENRGTAAAESLTFELESADDHRPPEVIGKEEPIRRLPPGGSVDYPLAVSMGTSMQWDVVFKWQENGEDRTERQSMG